MVKASAKSVRMSAKKAREVAALVSGRSVSDALVILEHTPRRAAKPISKVIKSAQANATNNHNMTEKSLMIESISVSEGGSMRRWRPAARGRALPYRHRLCHINVEVSGSVEAKKAAKKTEKPAETKKADSDKQTEAKEKK